MTRSRIKGAAALAGCAAMICFPSDTVKAAADGVTLWLHVVVPAMLPFFIFSNYMLRLGVPDDLGHFAGRAFDFAFRGGRQSAFVFFASVMSGYPMGPKLIGDLYASRKISMAEARRMLTFCCTSGPLFMLGAVGVGMLKSTEAGVIIAVSHYTGAILNGLLYRFADSKGSHVSTGTGTRTRTRTNAAKNTRIDANKAQSSKQRFNTGAHTRVDSGSNTRDKMNEVPDSRMHVDDDRHTRTDAGTNTRVKSQNGSHINAFTVSILEALKTLGIICAYVVLFSLATHLIDDLKLLNFIDSQEIRLMIKGMLEFTVGCSGITSIASDSMTVKITACTFLISFGGLSVAAQSLSVVGSVRVSTGYYLKVKLTHALLASCVSLLICMTSAGEKIASVSADIAAGVIVSVPNYGSRGLFEDPYGYLHGLLFSSNMCIILIAAFLLFRLVRFITSPAVAKKAEEDFDDTDI